MPPPTYVALEDVGKSLGTRTLLDGVTVGVTEGARIGVVGRNGGGKTTLVRVLTGLEDVDSGRVIRLGSVTIGLLAQTDDLDPAATLRDVVVGDRAEHEWAGDPRVRDVMGGLLGGVNADAYEGGLDAVIGTMSGGERRRAALARLLIDDPDLLVLDEPTNHLDVEAVSWLAHHLAPRRGALVAVTHDRWFLDEVATETWEVVDGSVHRYDGGYAAFVLARAERSRQAASSEERRQNLLRKELAWLRRGAPARTSKPKFRIDAANELIADEPPPRDRLALEKFATARLGKQVYDLEDVTVAPAAGAPPSSPARPGGSVPETASACSGPTASARPRSCGCSPRRTTACSTPRMPPTSAPGRSASASPCRSPRSRRRSPRPTRPTACSSRWSGRRSTSRSAAATHRARPGSRGWRPVALLVR